MKRLLQKHCPLGILLLSLAGCSTTPTQPMSPAALAAQAWQQAKHINNHHEKASAELHALQLALTQKHFSQAGQWRKELHGRHLTPLQQNALLHLDIILALQAEHNQAAKKILHPLLSLPLQAHTGLIHQLHLIRLWQAHQYSAALQFVTTQLDTRQPQAQDKLESLLWIMLQNLKPKTLVHLQKKQHTLAAQGWLALAQLNQKAERYPSQFKPLLKQWLNDYPRHAAHQLIHLNELTQKPTEQVAVLSKNNERSKAMVQGLLANHYAHPKQQQVSTIHVMNVTPASVLETYQAARKDKADLVIGPWDQDTVEALAPFVDQHSPLLLGQYSGHLASLAGSDHAVLPAIVAEQSLHPHPSTLWITHDRDNAVLKHYQQLAQAAAIPIHSTVLHGGNPKDWAAAWQRYASHDNYIILQTSPEQTTNMVEALTTGEHAKTTLVLLPSAYSSQGNGYQHEAFEYAVMWSAPWVIQAASGNPTQQAELYQALNQQWPKRLKANPMPFALGVDAWALSFQTLRLKTLEGSTYHGATGTYTMQDDTLHYQPMRSVFHQGQPIEQAGPSITEKALAFVVEQLPTA